MSKVNIIPISKRAKERVKQHGTIMLLKETRHDRFLVESLDNTWHGQKWMGWFTYEEATYSLNALSDDGLRKAPDA